MQYKGMNLCDFCFEQTAPGKVCPNCGLSHENYRAEAGLLPPGTNLLGKYIIGRVLGRGGFGATYLAYSSVHDGVVALKEYFPTGIAGRAQNQEKISIVSDEKRSVFEKGANRFFEEAKTMARFNTNKNVVSVYEFFYANDTVYYSMEFLRGIDLKGYIAKKGGKLGEAEAVTIMRGVCEALVAVHSTQTLHRDISPDNIFVCTNGDVKLIDFGAAKQVIGDAQQVYSVVLKQGFAPPEQYKTNGKQGVWTDMYAVGASIYYTVTGVVPADSLSRFENSEISFEGVNLSAPFKNIIVKCLQNKIEDRYQSAIELLADLEDLSTQNVMVGGTDYVQGVYNGVTANLQGSAVSFGSVVGSDVYNDVVAELQGNAVPFEKYDESTAWWIGSEINAEQFQSPQGEGQNYQGNIFTSEKDNSALVKSIIIGAASLIVAVCITIIVTTILTPPVGLPGLDVLF